MSIWVRSFSMVLLGAGLCLAEPSIGGWKTSAPNATVSVEWLKRQPNKKAAKFFEQGMQAGAERNFERAVSMLEKAVQADPNFAEGYLQWGVYLLWMGDSGGAIKQLQIASNLIPNDPIILTEIAMAHLMREQAAEAVRFARAAYDRDPTYPRGAFAVAVSLLRLNREAEAMPYLLRCRDHSPLARYHAARLLVQAGRGSEAKDDLEWLVKNKSPFADAARELMGSQQAGR